MIRPFTAGVEGALLFAEQLLQTREPFGFDCFVDLTFVLGCRRAGPCAVFERIGLGVAHLFDERHRVGEIGIGFTGKSDDEIARQRDVGPGRANTIDKPQVFRRRVLAVHRL